MKNLQKLILPALILITIAFIYFVFFSPQRGLGSFASLDPDSHANKEVKVRFISEDGIDRTSAPGKVAFYVQDKMGKKVLVTASSIPPGMENAENVVVVGHMHGNAFEAVEVKLE